MKYNINDEEAIYLVRENNVEAKDLLVEKYKYIIDILMKKYQRMAMALKIDNNDLYQEAMLGFADALDKYDDTKSASLKTFISLCVERKIQNYLKKHNTLKNKIMTESLSLEKSYDDDSSPLEIYLSDNNENNPLEKISSEENYNELKKAIENVLSDFEIQVFELMIMGLNYNAIAIKLGKTPKQVDNTIQRIKYKIKKTLNK